MQTMILNAAAAVVVMAGTRSGTSSGDLSLKQLLFTIIAVVIFFLIVWKVICYCTSCKNNDYEEPPHWKQWKKTR